MKNKVSIATTPLVYQTFRYISNKVWNALAEYVDNSIASFLSHREILSTINPNGKVRVDIDLDFDGDTIRISDNAFGIDSDNFDRAFELANIPLDVNGLNEFGMGMKVSSIWLSNLWSVETSAYNEDVKRKVEFDLEMVIAEEMVDLEVSESQEIATSHYTVVTLANLSQNKPGRRQLAYIKKHIASIYTKFIRDGVLDLYVNGELMEDKPLKILTAPYYRTPNASPIEWRREIEFNTGNDYHHYSVKGFIGILETQSTSTDNGLLLFRRGRAIDSSGDEKYRPTILSGEVGSPRYKRIFGELELEGFDVSFNKGTFLQDEDFDAFIKLLRDEIASDREFDIFGQAQHYTKPIQLPTKRTIASKLGSAFSPATISSDPGSTSNSVAALSPESFQTLSDNANGMSNGTQFTQLVVPPKTSSDEDHSEEKPLPLYHKEIPMTVDGYSFTIVLRAINSDTGQGLYSLECDNSDPNKFISTVNLKNPFFDSFANLLTKDDGIVPIVKFIQTMVSTEIMLGKQGQVDAALYFRTKFNSYFGKF